MVLNAASPLSHGPTMSFYWNRTLATSDALWDFSSWIPHAVIVYLGSNDFNNFVPPTIEVFSAAYDTLLLDIVSSYKDRMPAIISLCGGGSPSHKSNFDPCDSVQQASSAFATKHPHLSVHYIEIPIGVVTDDDWGCLGHRNFDGQTAIAHFLAEKIRPILGW